MLSSDLSSKQKELFAQRQSLLTSAVGAFDAMIDLATAGHVSLHAELADDVVELQRELARGATAVVHRGVLYGNVVRLLLLSSIDCIQIVLHLQPVAIKRFDESVIHHELNELRREIALMALLRHDNVVPFIGAHTTDVCLLCLL